jgi:hypothetical protein
MSKASVVELLNDPRSIDRLVRNVRMILAAINQYRQELVAGDEEAEFRLPVSDGDFEDAVSEYEMLCTAVNDRLTGCLMQINAGNPREAVRMAEEQPRLMDLFAAIDLSDPERQDWEDFLVTNERPVPTFIHRDKAETLSEAYGQQSPDVDRLAAELRILILARAPLGERLGVLRKLAALDARFTSDLHEWKKVRLEQLDRDVDEAHRLRQSDPQSSISQLVALLNELTSGDWSDFQAERDDLEKKVDRRMRAVQDLLRSQPAAQPPVTTAAAPAVAKPPPPPVSRPKSPVPAGARNLPVESGGIPPYVNRSAPNDPPPDEVVNEPFPESTTAVAGSTWRPEIPAEPRPLTSPGKPTVQRAPAAGSRVLPFVIAGLAVVVCAGAFVFFYMVPRWKDEQLRLAAEREWEARLGAVQKASSQFQKELEEFNSLELRASSPIPSTERIRSAYKQYRDSEQAARDSVVQNQWERYLPEWNQKLAKTLDPLETPQKDLGGKVDKFLASIDDSLKLQRDNISKGALDEVAIVLRNKRQQLDDIQPLGEVLPPVRSRADQLLKLCAELLQQSASERDKNRRVTELDKSSAAIRSVDALNRYVDQLKDYVAAYPDDARGRAFEEVLRERVLWQSAVEQEKRVGVGWLDQKDGTWRCRSRWSNSLKLELKLPVGDPKALRWQTVGTIKAGIPELNSASSAYFQRGRLVFVELSP